MTVKELINELLLQLEEKGDCEVFMADDYYGELLSVEPIRKVRREYLVNCNGDTVADAIVLDLD